MSSKSFVVDLTKSMIIIDPNDFPMNLGKSFREDAPSEGFPVQAFEASNVMPTPVGYKSYFNEATRFQLTALPALTQKVLAYQSINLDSILVALGEYGIKISRPMTGGYSDWETLLDTSVSAVVDVRRLWTHCVIANKVYLYQQGADRFYALVDQASYNDAVTPSLIPGATRTRLWNKWSTGFLSYIPSFLNMTGQIGLFRAKNRLGFWDSENAVSWSSAVAIEDFRPNAQTFAGVTKFADVQGRIVSVLGSGDSFIIYATRSIVMASGLENSPERWAGRAIMTEVGVAFDTQIAVTKPDQVQFCITQAGLLQIANGTPEYIATEVMDYLAKTSKIVSLFIIEGRYLFLSTTNTFPSGEYKVTGELVSDFDGNEFLFPKPVYPTTLEGKLAASAGGNNGLDFGSFGDYKPIVPLASIEKGKNLVPCYDIDGFDSTWANNTFGSTTTGSVALISKINDIARFVIDGHRPKPVGSVNSYYTAHVFDKATDEFITAIMAIHARYMNHINYQESYLNLFATLDFPVDIRKDARPDDVVGNTAIWNNEKIDTETVFDLINPTDLKLKESACGFKVYFDRFTNAKVTYKFTGTEEIVSGPLQYLFMDGLGIKSQTITGTYLAQDSNGADAGNIVGTGVVNTNSLATWVSWILTPDLAAEINAYKATKAGVTAWDIVTDVNSTNTHTMEMVGRYLLRFHPEAITESSHPVSAVLNYMKQAYSGDFTTGTWQYFDGPTETGVGGRQFVKRLHIGCSFELGPAPFKSASVFIKPPDIYGELVTPTPADFTCSPEDRAATILFEATNSFSTVVTQPAYFWDDTAKAAIYATYGPPSPTGTKKLHKLVGSITAEYKIEAGQKTDVTLYDAEISGWGYFPTGGFSFRKTHLRVSSTLCIIPGPGAPVLGNLTAGGPTDPQFDPTIPPYTVNPPVNWDYPDSIALPPNYTLFQKGSLAPYYPTYKNAVVYDMLLQKWGTYNTEHKHVYELMPVNRIDNTITPLPDSGMFAGALATNGECTIFEDGNPNSYIIYGKMGFYRRGLSFATEVRAHFSKAATGYLIIESSIDGVRADPSLSYTVTITNQRNAILPFTRRAKWFTIRVIGNFNLNYLELLAEEKSRR